MLGQVGSRAYLFNRIGSPALLTYDLPERPRSGNAIDAAADRFAEQPNHPLGDDMTISPDGQHLLCNSGSVFRLAGLGRVACCAPGGGRSARCCRGKPRSAGSWGDGHTGRVLALAYAPDGRQLLSGGEDARMVVRTMATGTVVRTLAADGGVYAAAWSADGRQWSAATWSGTTYVALASSHTPWRQVRGGLARRADTIAFTPKYCRRGGRR